MEDWRTQLRREALDAPLPCEGCGTDLRTQKPWGERLCRNRCCVEWSCAECGHSLGGGYGPAGCRCQVSGPNPLSIDGHAYARRRRNRRR